ncbi:hypothetical protein GCM10007913_36030 [Devosia yakushimensis]|uniref:DUF3592 domain-containing protein n=1 Tax=Devosia yakushimensis TaxID=470028 RepID=A0ABQ5UI61_9HYPH|nr:hypothetical protein [Devosia yakushimensis]GLQ11671.1 hypothetical protein GCM10007913_36030 [Devosia yakushimensis]
MTDLASAFPTRPLKLAKTGIVPGIFSYLGGLLLLGIGGFIAVWQVPGIVNDWVISQNPVVVYDSTVTDGHCTTRRAIFVDCEAHVTYTVKGKTFERDIELMFVDFNTGDYEVEVVRSGDKPQIVGLSLGLDMLWNRIIVGSGFVLLMGVLGAVLLFKGAQADQVRRLARKPLKLTAVPVTVTSISNVLGGKAVTYALPRPGKKRGTNVTSRMGRKQEPFWLNGDGQALAALHEGSKTPILLDAELTRLELTDEERRKIEAARDGVEAV